MCPASSFTFAAFPLSAWFGDMAKKGKHRLLMRELPLLAVMVKGPVCGAVKTRLAKEIGAVEAASLYRKLTAQLLRNVWRDSRFRTVLSISPDAALAARFAAWAVPAKRRRRNGSIGVPTALLPSQSSSASRIRQARGDLGHRMQALFETQGRGPLVIVGSDIPFVTREIIADAFQKLGSADAVVGPAEDGGYWLIGLRRRPRCPKPFAKVRWSGEHALADTMLNLAGLHIEMVETLFDVDTLADYRRYLAGC
jgi:uncharacterized protein